MASTASMADALVDRARRAQGHRAASTDGSVAVGVTPSTPAQPRRRARPSGCAPRDPDGLRRADRSRGGVALHAARPPARAARRRAVRRPPRRRRASCPRASSSSSVPTAELDVPAPVDRLAALALRASGTALVVRVPKALELDEPVVLRLTGTGTGEVVWGHVVVDVAEQARVTVVLEHTGSAHYAASVSVLVGDGAALQLVQVQDWADDAVHGAPRREPARPRRAPRCRRRHPRRRPGPAQRDRRLHRPRRRRRAARRLLRRRRPAPRAPAARRPQRRRTAAARDLQVGAAGRRGAHRLDRRRAHPRRRDRHRHLRAQPQPAAHARGARRLGAQPRDRDRRDRRRRARLGDRPLRRRAAVLPAVARHPGRRRAPHGRARLLRRGRRGHRRARRSRSA